MNKTQLFLIIALHAYSLSAQMVTQRQTSISNILYETTELPDDLIDIIVDYDALILPSNSQSVLNILFIEPNRLVATYSDLTIRVWNLKKFDCEIIFEHETDISAIAALSQNEIAVGEGNNSIKIWNIDTGTCRKVLKGNESPIVGLVALENKQLASASNIPLHPLGKTGIIIIWNHTTGTPIRKIETSRPIYSLWPAKIKNFPLVIVTEREVDQTDDSDSESRSRPQPKIIVFVDPEDATQIEAHFDGPRSQAFSFLSLDSKSLKSATAERNQVIYLYDKGECRTFTPSFFKSIFTPFLRTFFTYPTIVLALIKKNQLASAGWSDKKVRVIDTESMQCTEEFDVIGQATSIAPLPENKIAIGCNNGEIEIINTSPLKKVTT